MTRNQTEQFNRMARTLRRISKDYQTPEQINRHSFRDFGCGSHEALEMAYENIQQEARNAVRGVRLFSRKTRGRTGGQGDE